MGPGAAGSPDQHLSRRALRVAAFCALVALAVLVAVELPGWIRGDGDGLAVVARDVVIILVGTAAIAILLTREARRLQQAEARVLERSAENRAVFEAGPEPMWVCDRDTLAILDVNARALELTGYTQAEMLALSALDLHEPGSRERARAALQARRSGYEWRLRTRDGGQRFVDITVQTLDRDDRSLLLVVAVDHTEATRAGVARTIGHRVDQLLLRGGTVVEAMQLVCEGLVDALDLRLAAVAAADPDGGVRILSSSGPGVAYLDGMIVRWDDSPEGRGPAGMALRSGQPVRAERSSDTFAPWHQRAAANDIEVTLCLPVHTGEEPPGLGAGGVLAVYARHTTDLGPTTVGQLETVAARLSVAFGVARDQERLRLQAAATSAAANAMFITDAEHVIIWVNRAFVELSGYAEAEVLGTTPAVLSSGLTSPDVYAGMYAAMAGGRPWQGELLDRRKDGSLYLIRQTITPIRDDLDRVTHYVAIHEDLAERREAEDRLDHLATHDELTDLPNRVLLGDRVERALTATDRRGVALVVVGLDNFASVNEAFGPAAGDELLREAGARLGTALDDVDTVARLAGDEFAVLVPDVSSPAVAALAADQLLDCLRRPFTVAGEQIYLTASGGLSLHPGDTDDPAQFVANATTAMRQAKREGADRCLFHTSALNEQTADLLRLRADLHRALEQEQFVLHYQPEIDLRSGRVIGLEALIRWEHPTLGLLGPARFIAIAEETSLIVPITEWVLHTGAAAVRNWRSLGHDRLRLSVNISPNHFGQGDVAGQIGRILHQEALPGDALAVEITEGAVMSDLEAGTHGLEALARLGVRISIDDFGTGYSSLSRLKHLPIDELKVDRSFVDGLPHDLADTAIVDAIVGLGHHLGLQVVAEGIETLDELTHLRQAGCDIGQGYLFSRPVPEREATELLEGSYRTIDLVARPGVAPEGSDLPHPQDRRPD